VQAGRRRFGGGGSMVVGLTEISEFKDSSPEPLTEVRFAQLHPCCPLLKFDWRFLVSCVPR